MVKEYLNKIVEVKMDRPMGSRHPKKGFIYPVNYGYIPNTISGDGEELDAYVLGIHEQINDGIDGVLVDLNNLDDASKKIKKYFNNQKMKKMNEMSQKRLQEEYDFEKICEEFIFKFLR